ncbi:MAG: SDR family NAD(P)-dependent oxidoreductase [Proteobacteria bacterium]|nr:SDR family NAD(P)-dependent oxidoreductase [Pseudomonadota bacterium]MCP4918675.1 SDR family NAD(P)-dependent oxidoreductase [Pseudomonadota bacterium]
MRFSDQVVVISGATSGIGLSLARAFTREGAKVVALGRNQDRLAQVGREVDLAMTCDVTSDKQVEVAIDAAVARYGRIDVLVNNAGVGLFEDVLDTSMGQLEQVMAVNLVGMARLTQAALPSLIESRGRVVQIASVAGQRGYARHTAYCASKHAMIGWSEALRCDVAGAVDVVVVCPPAVDTTFFENAGYTTFEEDHPGLQLWTADQVAEETLDATHRREARRILGLRAKALYAASLVPGPLDALRRATGKVKKRG